MVKNKSKVTIVTRKNGVTSVTLKKKNLIRYCKLLNSTAILTQRRFHWQLSWNLKQKESLDHTVNLQEITQQTLQGLQSTFYTACLYRAPLLIWTVISDGPCTSSYYIGLVKLQKKEKTQTNPKQTKKPTPTQTKKKTTLVKTVLQFLR